MQRPAKNNRVLLLDPNHPLLEERLAGAGFQCDYFPSLTLSQLEEMIPDYAGIIVRSRFRLDAALLERARNLCFIGRVGAGMEGIDSVYAADHGIRCFNAPEGNRDAVGEHALGMLLALMNRMFIADGEVRKGVWQREENRGVELGGKCVGIIGYGNTGGAFARRLSGFGCTVLAYDKYRKGYADAFAVEAGMDEIREKADVLSLHVPLTPETRHLADSAYFDSFSKNIWLINTSRGPVVDTPALVAALKGGKVLGAALDVLEYENASFESLSEKEMPETFRELVNLNRVILTPHIAGWTHESKVKLAKVIAEKILVEFRAP
jgi:D-3-phosphoglycerate dehydrogenase / 2-oxoglutarate reductase